MVKILLFNQQRLKLAENSFLFDSTLLFTTLRMSVLHQILVLQFLPAIAYALFLMIVSIKHQLHEPTLIIIATLVLLVFVSALIFNYSIHHRSFEVRTSWLKRSIDRYAIRPITLIYLSTTMRAEPFLLIGTKIFTSVLLFAVLQLYLHEAFDERLLAMTCSLCAVANFMVIRQLQLFDFKYFKLSLNLPISLAHRWLRILLVVVSLMIPEAVIVFNQSQNLPLELVTVALCLLPSVGILGYALTFLRWRNPETGSRLIFVVALAHIMLILFGIPVICFIIIDMLLSYWIFVSHWKKFEYTSNDPVPYNT